MTLDEAQAIGMIAGTADNGCDTCVGKLVKRLNERFPAFVWTMTADEQYEPSDYDPDEPMMVGLVVTVQAA
jgi:hypothetical protein